jgi:hypothetical protein
MCIYLYTYIYKIYMCAHIYVAICTPISTGTLFHTECSIHMF